MNIKDVKNVPTCKPESYLHAIFARQNELLIKYKDIEGLPDYPLDIDWGENQVWIKDFLWRTCEEIAESMEAAALGHFEHQLEELSDALHFIVEAMILAGVDPPVWELSVYVPIGLPYSRDEYDSACLSVFFTAGMVGNCLKNKKWKQTQVPTDLKKFKLLLQETFEAVLRVFKACTCSAEDIYILYFKKSEVNKFRQRTKY